MALVLEALVEIMRKPTLGSMVSELLLFCGPLWASVLLGLLVGWVWRPKWAIRLVGVDEGKSGSVNPQLPSSSALEEGPSVALGFPSLQSLKAQLPSCVTALISGEGAEKVKDAAVTSPAEGGDQGLAVTTEDLKHLYQLAEETDGGPAWNQLMDRELQTMSYRAWHRDRQTGPPQYRSRSIFEDARPDTVRDFFWDDEFRMKAKWDDMLIYHKSLEECPTTGTMIVHWVRKFPFFCSNREYIIGRRIWESDGTFYCVTKVRTVFLSFHLHVCM